MEVNEESESALECPHCQAMIGSGSRKCSTCGESLDWQGTSFHVEPDPQAESLPKGNGPDKSGAVIESIGVSKEQAQTAKEQGCAIAAIGACVMAGSFMLITTSIGTMALMGVFLGIVSEEEFQAKKKELLARM